MTTGHSHAYSNSAEEAGVVRIFITGSADGLGRDAARQLLDEGHNVVLHA